MNRHNKSWRDMLDEHDPNYQDMREIDDDSAIDTFISIVAVVILFWLVYNMIYPAA